MIKLKKKEDVVRSYKRFVIFGPPDIGKSTAMGVIPKKALVFDLNNRWPKQLVNKHDFVEATSSFEKLLSDLKELVVSKPKEYDWLVLDTLTDAVALIDAHCVSNDCKGDENTFHAYGHGLRFTPGYMSRLLAALDEVGAATGMNLGIVAHATNRDVKNPLGKDYAKICLDMPDKVGSRVMQWADYVGYAHYNVSVRTEGLNKTKAGVQQRVIAFADNPAHEGKNGSAYKLPPLIPFDDKGEWSKVVFGEVTSLLVEAEELLNQIPDEMKEHMDIYSMDPQTLEDFVTQGKEYVAQKGKKGKK
jgi:AAA domain